VCLKPHTKVGPGDGPPRSIASVNPRGGIVEAVLPPSRLGRSPFEPLPAVAPTAGPALAGGRACARPPRADPVLRERGAFALPGWIAQLALLSGTAALALVLARVGLIPHFDALPDLRSSVGRANPLDTVTPGAIAVPAVAGLLVVVSLAGLLVNAAGQSRVLSRWGRYHGTVRRTGLLWVNPLLRRRRVDVRLRHWRGEPVTVVDRSGLPVVVRLLIVWRVKDTARALLSVADHENYLREQAYAVLTRTASTLPCESNVAPGPALRDGPWFADELTRSLAAEVAPAGLEVYSVQPLDLDYAPEVAERMRRRRLVDLDADVRALLVQDSAEAAAIAVGSLERATAQELDEPARRALTERLFVAFATSAPYGTAPYPASWPGNKEGKSA